MHNLRLGRVPPSGPGEYPSEGGYKPGDTWELYVGSDNRVQEFIFHRAECRRDVGGLQEGRPLLISTGHRGKADGKPLRVFFSDVSVKLTGSDTWTNAQ
jgi:hypothetical protein